MSLQDNGKLGVVIVNEPLDPQQRTQFDRVILQQQLKVAKQIVLLLRLLPTDFGLTGGGGGSDQTKTIVPVEESVMTYLFGNLPHVRERSNLYLNSVNNIYIDLRYGR